MRGVVERINPIQLEDGREYLSLQISGRNYSLWDKKYFDMLGEGMPVKFNFKKSGKYFNISDIEHDLDCRLGNNGNGNNNLFNYPSHRDLQIMKTSCLKCATYLVNHIPLEVDKKVELTLDVAKRLEKYLSIAPVEGEESLPGDSDDPGNMEEVF